MFNYTGKVVVVTGSSRGIGWAIAEKFYQCGACVIICSRKSEDIDNVLSKLEPYDSDRICGYAVDVSDMFQIKTFFENVIKRFGRIDILINNAGVQFPKPSVQVTLDDWNKTIDINLKGYFFCAQYAVKEMIKQSIAGCIVNIGSVNAVTVVEGQTVYALTKAAISQMTKSLGREWARAGIRVNCVAPGSIPTAINAEIYADKAVEKAMCEKIPMGRRGNPNEVSDAVLYLASEYASYITGQTLFVDGGLTLVHG